MLPAYLSLQTIGDSVGLPCQIISQIQGTRADLAQSRWTVTVCGPNDQLTNSLS